MSSVMDENDAMGVLRQFTTFWDQQYPKVQPMVRDIARLIQKAEECQKVIREFSLTREELEKTIDDLMKKKSHYEKRDYEDRLAFDGLLKEREQQRVAMNLEISRLKNEISEKERHLETLLDSEARIHSIAEKKKELDASLSKMKKEHKEQKANTK